MRDKSCQATFLLHVKNTVIFIVGNDNMPAWVWSVKTFKEQNHFHEATIAYLMHDANYWTQSDYTIFQQAS